MTPLKDSCSIADGSLPQLYAPIVKDYGVNMWEQGKTPQDFGIINQMGLNRKVRVLFMHMPAPAQSLVAVHLRLGPG